MKMTRHAMWLIPALLVMAPTPLLAQPAPLTSTAAGREDLAVTVYNENLGLVKDLRRVTLPKGTVPLRFSDVASSIDATSVSIRSITAPFDLDVLEQNYEYDLITPAKLMEKYVGREVEIRLPSEGDRPGSLVRATLISTNEGYVYRIGDKIHLTPPGQVILPDLPEDLVAKPSLIWTLDNKSGGNQKVEASYMTGGMGWQADYVVISRQDNKKADMTGWVTIRNQSGATYDNARLTLVAGDVNRAEEPQADMYMQERRMAAAPKASGQFTEQALFEYHSYDLNRRATLKNNQTKQLTLLSASNFATEKVFVFDGAGQRYFRGSDGKPKVRVMLEFENTKKNQLGMPLPKGRIRVYQEDAAKKLQFIGEDRVDHTPKDEKVRVVMGNAFDIVGEHRQMSQRNLSDKLREQSYEIRLRNHKDTAVTVHVVEHLYGDWRIIAKSHPFNKNNADEVDFPVRVPANGETKVTYTAQFVY